MALDDGLDEQPSIGGLVIQLTEQSGQLVREEVALAKAELRAEIKHAGIGAGLLGSAGLVAVFGTATLVVAAVAGLATAVDVWLAALVVAVALFLVAGIAALLGKKQVDQVGAPEHTIASVRADVAEIRGAGREHS